MTTTEPRYKYSSHSGYEVSSKGDSRFSALFALMPDGRTLENHYQCDVKQHNPGGTNWRDYKGQPPKNKYLTPELLYAKYLELWQIWANHNPDLIADLKLYADNHGGVLRDSFATSQVNQARALAQILTEKFS